MKREPMKTSHSASKIMQNAIAQCRRLYPKGTRLVIRFNDRLRNTCCTVHSCLGAQYTVEIDSTGELRNFHPEIQLHRFRSEQRDLFTTNQHATTPQPENSHAHSHS